MRSRLSVFHTELSSSENRNSIMKAPRNDGMSVYPNRATRANLFCASEHVFLERKRRMCQRRIPRADYFCLTAIAEISIRALFTRAAAWMVARAGLGSGITLL